MTDVVLRAEGARWDADRPERPGPRHSSAGPAAAVSGWALRLGRARGCQNPAELANNEGISVMSVLQLPEGESADFSQGEV